MLAMVAVSASVAVLPRGVPQLARAGSNELRRRLGGKDGGSKVEVSGDDGGSEGDDWWNQPNDRDDAAPVRLLWGFPFCCRR